MLSRFFEVTAVYDLLWNSFGRETLIVLVSWCSWHTWEWIKVLLFCVYKCQLGKCFFFFLPRFKSFHYLDPLVTPQPAAFQGLLKKYLFLGEIYFEELENSLYLLCSVKSKRGAGFSCWNISFEYFLGYYKVTPEKSGLSLCPIFLLPAPNQCCVPCPCELQSSTNYEESSDGKYRTQLLLWASSTNWVVFIISFQATACFRSASASCVSCEMSASTRSAFWLPYNK